MVAALMVKRMMLSRIKGELIQLEKEYCLAIYANLLNSEGVIRF